MTEILAKQGQRLDQIAYGHYGTLQSFAQVLKANRPLLSKPILDAGDRVYLPPLPKEQPTPSKRALWD